MYLRINTALQLQTGPNWLEMQSACAHREISVIKCIECFKKPAFFTKGTGYLQYTETSTKFTSCPPDRTLHKQILVTRGLRRRLKPLDSWDRGFESRRQHGYSSFVFVAFCICGVTCDELITLQTSHTVCSVYLLLWELWTLTLTLSTPELSCSDREWTEYLVWISVKKLSAP